MPERFAIYFAPERGSPFDERATAWLARPDLSHLTVSARRYGFHATLKAPMRLRSSRGDLERALAAFAARPRPIALAGLAPRLIDGFLALTTEPQPQEVTDFAAEVVAAFEPYRAPLEASERDRRLSAPLTPRQIEFVDRYGYPYVLEEFRFHMTLTDRLTQEDQSRLLAAASDWFAPGLRQQILLDRLVLFREPEAGGDFVRFADYPLEGTP